MDAKNACTVQSIDRIFTIMEVLSQHPRGMSLTDVCTETDLPKGTTSRLLASLITHRYAVQEPDTKRYRMTLRMFEIGCRVADSTNIRSVAQPYLESLSSVTGEAVHLVARLQDDVVYLHKEEATHSIVRMSSFVGRHNPMYCTGVGKSILAFLPDQEITEIWNRIEHIQYTPNTITDLPTLMEEIKTIRTCGYATDNEEHELGVCCIAAPIHNFDGVPVAAISISAPRIRLDCEKLKDFAPMLLEAADNISHYFGN